MGEIGPPAGLHLVTNVLAETGIDFSAPERFDELRALRKDGLVIGGTGVLLAARLRP